ncbi:hypothetical protein HUJ04_005804 [Dendroctonus ponderosae]|nr:hypothetical protein HUJ04_005804 [Dendroctonus ponderosae]KAH1001844.1 hypothetical protein HUJ04_005804 [Dendroctonus ponderosae]
MSWQDYVDKQLLASRCVTKAAIAGHDGNVWAKSEDFELRPTGICTVASSPKKTGQAVGQLTQQANDEVSKEELAKLVQGFEKQDILTSSGVTLAGNRYIYLSGTDRVIRAKLGKVGVHCMKTTQAVVVSLYEDPIQPQQAASVVEKLGDYLITCGY